MEQKLISILLNTDNNTFNLAIVERQSNRVDGVYYSVHEILLYDMESKEVGLFFNKESLKLINSYKAKGYDFSEKILSWCPDSCEAFPINPGTKNYRKSLKNKEKPMADSAEKGLLTAAGEAHLPSDEDKSDDCPDFNECNLKYHACNGKDCPWRSTDEK